MITKRLLAATAALTLAVLFYSCGSDEPLPFRVFVGGEDVLDTMNSGAKLPTVWVNGKPTYLKTGQDIAHQYVKDVTFHANNFYATGYENTVNGWVAKVWKNENLIHSFGEANASLNGNAIAVANDNVYVAATKADFIQERQIALIIKNSTITVLNSSTTTSAQALAIAVSGSDVYVGGWEDDEARLWKNGTIIELPNSQNYRINSIVVNGSDVYAVGECNCWEGARARYWKNGVVTDLSSETEIAFGYSIAVSGNDVYMAGVDYVNSKWRAKVWKNGAATVLTPEGIVGWARDITVDGSTVYVAGEQLSANTIFSYAMLWTDGEPAKLGTRRSRAFGVAISK